MPSGGWSREKVKRDFDQLVFENGHVYTKTYKKVGNIMRSVLDHSRFGRTSTGSIEVRHLLDGKHFDYPKPLGLIKSLVTIGSDSDSIILDFFAGSGTTGHAIMAANASDGGNRHYIMVQLPEPVKSDQFDTIADITRERIRRAGKIISTESDKPVDIGFRAYSIDEASSDDTNRESQKRLNAGLELIEQSSSGELDMDTLDDVLLAT